MPGICNFTTVQIEEDSCMRVHCPDGTACNCECNMGEEGTKPAISTSKSVRHTAKHNDSKAHSQVTTCRSARHTAKHRGGAGTQPSVVEEQALSQALVSAILSYKTEWHTAKRYVAYSQRILHKAEDNMAHSQKRCGAQPREAHQWCKA